MCGRVRFCVVKRLRLMSAAAALAIAALPITASPSFSDEAPPTLDSAKYCDATVTSMFRSDSDAIKLEETKKCMEREAEYAASLARIWPHVWPQDQNACLALTTSAEPSYQKVASCVSLALSKHILEPDTGAKTIESSPSLSKPQKVGDLEGPVIAHRMVRRAGSQRSCAHLIGRNWSCARQLARGTRPLIEVKLHLGGK
jgi:hypothetical protein